jgi:hypothetical protein
LPRPTLFAEFDNSTTQSILSIQPTVTREFLSGVEAPANSLLSSPSVQERNGVRADIETQPDVRALNSLALRSLVSLFDEKEQLFSHRVTLTRDGLPWDATSRKRTIIALLGLHRLAESGGSVPFDVSSIREEVLRDSGWVTNAGELGLLTWFAAVCAPDRLETIFKQFDFGKALSAYPDGRQARTTGLAWFLAGVAHARLACPEGLPDLTDVVVDTYHLLKNNQSDSGIFGHAGLPGFPRETLYSRLGSFTDQIYAIYALSIFARAFQVEEPLESALGCANAVCSLQGEMGQWWFLYDKLTTRVVTPYPVFSAHQDGTAPFGLFALEEVTGRSFQRAIFKGLSWIAGANELGEDLRNLDRGLIWHSIGPKRRIGRYWEAALGVMNISRGPQADRLRIRYESRPDHAGWLLYALGKFGLPTTTIAAKAATAH